MRGWVSITRSSCVVNIRLLGGILCEVVTASLSPHTPPPSRTITLPPPHHHVPSHYPPPSPSSPPRHTHRSQEKDTQTITGNKVCLYCPVSSSVYVWIGLDSMYDHAQTREWLFHCSCAYQSSHSSLFISTSSCCIQPSFVS